MIGTLKHFDGILNREDVHEDVIDANEAKPKNTVSHELPGCIVNEICNAPITAEEVEREINTLKSGKAAGPDKVIAEFIKVNM